MRPSLKSLIRKYSSSITDSQGKKYRGLSLRATARVAAEAGVSRREVEIAALRAGIAPCRYHKSIPALGLDGQAALLSSCVAVVGAGGLGGTVIELLARLGVGRLLIIDGESFSEDNLNRQVLCREADLGRKKVEVAAERVKAINSSVETVPRAVFLTEDNGQKLLAGSQVAIDALDRIKVRIILEKVTGAMKIPLVHGAIGGFLGEVASVFPGEKILSALYGEKAPPTAKGVEAFLGTPTPTPAIIAGLEVMEAVKILLKRGEPLRERLLYLELEPGTVSEIRFSP